MHQPGQLEAFDKWPSEYEGHRHVAQTLRDEHPSRYAGGEIERIALRLRPQQMGIDKHEAANSRCLTKCDPKRPKDCAAIAVVDVVDGERECQGEPGERPDQILKRDLYDVHAVPPLTGAAFTGGKRCVRGERLLSQAA